MYPKNILRCYDKAIDKKTCNKIIKVGKSKKLQDAKIEAHGKPTVDEKIRRTNLSWTNESWIYDLVTPYIENANIANKWNYHWDWCENIQFGVYTKASHYAWHCDIRKGPYTSEDPHFNNKVRKISLILTLNDKFKGGVVEIWNKTPEKFKGKQDIFRVKEMANQGSIIVFNSVTFHRVLPVTEGTRYSLVVWALGNDWK